MNNLPTYSKNKMPNNNTQSNPPKLFNFQTSTRNKQLNPSVSKHNFEKVHISKSHEIEEWDKRAKLQIQYCPKIILQKSSGTILVELGQGCLLQYIKKCKLNIKTTLLQNTFKSINDLSQIYGYFYLDKHMMKISKDKQPLIWIHHNFKINNRQFPINQNSFTQKIFYDNIKRVLSPIIQFPCGISILSEMIQYLNKNSHKIVWKNVQSQSISRNSYSTTNGRVYSNLSNSPSGTTIPESNQLKSIKSSELIGKKSSKKNVVKKIQIKDHHPYLFNSQSKKALWIQNGNDSEHSFSRSKNQQSQQKSVKQFNQDSKVKGNHQFQNITKFENLPKCQYLNKNSNQRQKLKNNKHNYVSNSNKQRKQSANTEIIKQWISTNLQKKFPYSTFSASTRVTCDTYSQEEIAQPNSPCYSAKQVGQKNALYKADQNIKQLEIKQDNKKIRGQKWIDNYGGSNKISWGINSEIVQQEDSVMDEVDKLFDSGVQKQGKKELKESELAKQIQNLFDSEISQNKKQEKNQEYLSQFQHILI